MSMAHAKDPVGEENIKSLGKHSSGLLCLFFQLLVVVNIDRALCPVRTQLFTRRYLPAMPSPHPSSSPRLKC